MINKSQINRHSAACLLIFSVALLYTQIADDGPVSLARYLIIPCAKRFGVLIFKISIRFRTSNCKM